MTDLLVIEDGDEYVRFVEALLPELSCQRVASGAAALAEAAEARAFLVDLRFDRAAPTTLCGDRELVARELYGGDEARALRHLHDEQGVYILQALRRAGHRQRALFVHDFSPRRLAHLRERYGDVAAVRSFDAVAIRAELART
jgi:CheY-like chemotaxis protein